MKQRTDLPFGIFYIISYYLTNSKGTRRNTSVPGELSRDTGCGDTPHHIMSGIARMRGDILPLCGALPRHRLRRHAAYIILFDEQQGRAAIDLRFVELCRDTGCADTAPASQSRGSVTDTEMKGKTNSIMLTLAVECGIMFGAALVQKSNNKGENK